MAAIESLQVLVQTLQIRIADLQGMLEEEKMLNDSLRQVLGDMLASDTAASSTPALSAAVPSAAAALPDDLTARSVTPVYPGKELAVALAPLEKVAAALEGTPSSPAGNA